MVPKIFGFKVGEELISDYQGINKRRDLNHFLWSSGYKMHKNFKEGRERDENLERLRQSSSTTDEQHQKKI